jgi:hypothetical protein
MFKVRPHGKQIFDLWKNFCWNLMVTQGQFEKKNYKNSSFGLARKNS